MSNLQELKLHHNQLTSLPSQIGQLNNLQKLYLDYNQLTTLPAELGELSNLHWLELRGNQLTGLPPEIGQMYSLRGLIVMNNRLTTLPFEIGQLVNLCVLKLENNNIQHLPMTLSSLNLLAPEACYYDAHAGLWLDNNPLISPPPEVVEQGTAAVLAYLRNQAWYHTQRLILGAAGGVGMFALLLLGFRWKQRGGRKSKQKRS